MRKSSSGFTIVELLIVIVVIGILAAITIVAYNGVQNRAHDTAIKNDLSNVAKKQELFKIDSDADQYAYGNGSTGYEALGLKFTHSAYLESTTSGHYNLLNCTALATHGGPGANYAMLAVSKSGKRFYISSESGGVQEYTGPTAWLTTGSCTSVLPNSVANGAGYAADTKWRAWAQ